MTTTKSKTAEPEVPAEPTAEETAAAAGLPDLRLGSDIGAEAAAALAELPQDEPEPEEAAAARRAAESDEMTAAAMRAAADEPLPPALAAQLAGNAAGDEVAVLAPLWAAWQDCRAVTEGECAAWLDEWEAAALLAIYGPLITYRNTGTPSEPVEDRWRTPATA